MFTSLHCIALHTVRHSDTRSILTAWSAELGRISIGMPDGKGREASRRRALTMPLSMFEAVGDVRPGREIISVRDLRPSAGSPTSAPPSPARTMLQLFLADALDRILRQSTPDPLLSRFIFDSLNRLGRLTSAAALANFHIVFLFRLTRFLGIAPDTSIPSGASPEKMIFDLREASFRPTLPSHPLFYTGKDAAAVRLVGRLTFENMHRAHFTRDERSKIIDGIIDYYHLHLSPSGTILSLDILKTLR